MNWGLSKWLGKCGCNVTISISSCIRCDDDVVKIELIIGNSPITLSYDLESFLSLSKTSTSQIDNTIDKGSVFTLEVLDESAVNIEEDMVSIMKIINDGISGININIDEESEISEEDVIQSLISELKNKNSNQSDIINNNSSTITNTDSKSNIE